MKKNILIYYDLITTLKTTQETNAFKSEVKTLINLSKSGKSLTSVLESISENSAKKIRQVVSKNKLDLKKRETMIDFFVTLEKLLNKFKVIKLVLAFDPSLKTIENIHSYLKDTLGIGYILDIEVSANLLAGAVVIHDGKYKDYSLNKAIEDTFADKSTEILKFMQ